jgi:hypothetical protein
MTSDQPLFFTKQPPTTGAPASTHQLSSRPSLSLRQMCLLAREVICLGPLVAFSGYNLESLSLDSCVTTKDWQLIHEPANPGLKLKFVSSATMGSSSLNTKRLTLAGCESVIDVNDNLREILSLEDYKNTLHTLSKAMHLALPWNHSVNAIEDFMHATNFCTKELALFSIRPHLLATFTDHVLNGNSKCWVNKQQYLGAADLRPFFNQWAGFRSLNVFSARSPDSDDTGRSRFNNRGKWQFKSFNNFQSNKETGDESKELELCRRYNAVPVPTPTETATLDRTALVTSFCSVLLC